MMEYTNGSSTLRHQNSNPSTLRRQNSNPSTLRKASTSTFETAFASASASSTFASASASTGSINADARNKSSSNQYPARTISRSALQSRNYNHNDHSSRPSTPPNRHAQFLNKGKASASSITADTTAAASFRHQASGRSSITDDYEQKRLGEFRTVDYEQHRQRDFRDEQHRLGDSISDDAHGFGFNHDRDPDTHRQSWHSVTRDSVVDNLLLSFDRMPGFDFASPPSGLHYMDDDNDDDQFSDAATPPPLGIRSNRARGHTYSSSMSSSMTADDASGIFKPNFANRERRSGSTSSFASTPVSRQQMRDSRPTARQRSSSALSDPQRTPRPDLRSRVLGRPGSKSSVASTVDHTGSVKNLHSERLGRRLQSRSPSRDNIATQSAPDLNPKPVNSYQPANSILSRGRPVPSAYSTYDGASHSQSSRNASKSSKSRTAVDKTHDLANNFLNWGSSQAIPQSIRDQASEFVKANNSRHDSPPVHDSPPAAASSTHNSMTANEAALQRPGFFRRVFGASTPKQQLSREFSLHNTSLLQQQVKGAGPVAPIPTGNSESNLPKPLPAAPAVPAVVNKKSSFFRRRKPISEETQEPRDIQEIQETKPPIIPRHIPSSVAVDDPSSPGASSLRKVLDRYLEPDGSPTLSKSTPVRLAQLRRDGDSDSIDMRHVESASTVDEPPRRSMPMDGVLSGAIDSDLPTRERSGSFASHSKQRTNAPLAPSSLKIPRAQLAVSGSLGPVSPLAPSSHKSQYSTPVSPVASQTEVGHISPGATIRAVTQKFGNGSSTEADYGVAESKGLAIEFPHNKRKQRLWIESAGEEDDDGSRSLGSPLSGHTRSQPPAVMQETLNLNRRGDVPTVELNGNEVRPSTDIARQLDVAADAGPTQEDMDRAKAILAGEEESIGRSTAAAWLGERTDVSSRTLIAYMSLFDWTGQNILSAMRSLCDKLVLKGESQQVDRVLEAFANRWHECNPNNGFKGPSVIHNVCYALLLLNTDQHVASIQHKMTRSEFIKNTMPPIKDAAELTVKATGTLTPRPAMSYANSTNSLVTEPSVIPQQGNDEAGEGLSADVKRIMKRQSFRPNMPRSDTDPGSSSLDVNTYASNILINSEWEGSERGWLGEIETVLKSFYTSIVADALPLHGASDREGMNSATPSLSVQSSQLRRTGSILSKAPSEGTFTTYRGRSKTADSQSLAQRMHPKNRTRQKVYSSSTRTSFEDGASLMSPAGSSMWSRISTGKTQPTTSVESFARTHDFKQSLGFTNALSQAIIREEHEATFDSESFHRMGSLLEDESLELAGAPWAKEGMVKHKHHLEGPDRKAKERSWNECFAVVEKGYLHLFSFDRATTKISSGTIRARARRNTTSAKIASKAAGNTPSVVGGGNWTDSANEKEQFLLRQTIATTLPAPGYNKARPFVWALSLPNGSVHLFQVGTMEIAIEFATSANYWSARLSKEPLVGGIDNIEYGWSDHVLNPALVGTTHTQSPPPSRGGPGHSHSNSLSTITGMAARPSQSSIGTFDQTKTTRLRGNSDRIVISDWRPPPSSMLPSQLMEIDQLRSLKAYITSVDLELERHNELRAALPVAYAGSGSARLSKVLSNWEKKSSYLLKESVKFRTYVEALEKAGVRRELVYEERRVRDEAAAAAGKSTAGSIASG